MFVIVDDPEAGATIDKLPNLQDEVPGSLLSLKIHSAFIESASLDKIAEQQALSQTLRLCTSLQKILDKHENIELDIFKTSNLVVTDCL